MGTTDFRPFIGRIRRDVNVVATLVPGADGIRFIKQYEEFGLKGKIQVVDTAPASPISPVTAAGPGAGNVSFATYVYIIDNPRNQQFVQAFRASMDEPGGPGNPPI